MAKKNQKFSADFPFFFRFPIFRFRVLGMAQKKLARPKDMASIPGVLLTSFYRTLSYY